MEKNTGRVLLILVTSILFAGCLGEPEIEDNWTRVDIQSEDLSARQPLTAGVACTVSVSASVTYRRIITGFAVTELRATGVVSPLTARISKSAPRLPMAQDIDYLLQNSATMGRATRAVTGWDHLIQDISFNFVANVPTTLDSTVAPPGSSINLYLVSYLGEGEEIELADGSDSLVVTPFISTDYEVLPIGVPISVAGGSVP